MIWTSVGELLDMFCVERGAVGALWFEALAETIAAYKAFPELGVSTQDIIRGHMSRYHVSSMIYWANQRRALRNILEADIQTLRELGLDVPDDFKMGQFAVVVGEALARQGGQSYELAAELAPTYRRKEGKK